MKVLLLGEKEFLFDTDQKKISIQYGMIDLTKINRYGQRIKTNTGHEFLVVKPTFIDLLKKCRRGPQIIMPKDAGQIVAVTGASNGWQCLDAGGGSGFLSLFLGNIVTPNGSIVTYERNKQSCELIKKNVRFCGLEKIITIQNKDILKGIKEKNLDLITLDMINANKVVPAAYRAIKPGGWLCIYSPQIEQQKKAVKAVHASKIQFRDVKTLETMQRFWKVDNRGLGYTHPHPKQIVHTGFLTFGRKT